MIDDVHMSLDIEKHNLYKIISRYFDIPISHAPVPMEQNQLDILLHRMADCGLLLCGGAVLSAVTGDKVNDLDFYLKKPECLLIASILLEEYGFKMHLVTENAVTLKRKAEKSNRVYTVQIIKRFTGSPSSIFSTFDFTVTQCAFDFSSRQFSFGPRTLQDIARRKLVYLGGSRYPICAMYRTKKYGAKGYSVSGSTIMHIALSIVRLEITTYKQLKDQLMGIDTMFLQGLLAGIEYQDHLPVDYGKFLVDAFERIDGVSYADEEDEIIDEQV
jgi:hypothetical protein